MATDLERFTAICNNLVDGVATVGQRVVVGDAFVALLPDERLAQVLDLPISVPPSAPIDREALTNEQRARVVNAAWLAFTRSTVRAHQLKVAKDAAEAGVLAQPDTL